MRIVVMNAILARIAQKIAAGDEKPPAFSFGLECHAYLDDVAGSAIDEDLKQDFSLVLRKKRELQQAFEEFDAIQGELHPKTKDKAFENLSFVKPHVTDALRQLMARVEPRLGRWLAKFDTTFEKLAAYEFPFDQENAWYVDLWVQQVHELVTAMFIACGGSVMTVVRTDDIPEELRQPDWQPGQRIDFTPPRTHWDPEDEVSEPLSNEETMNPEKLASELRQIAAKIDNSKNPDRRLVAAAIGQVLVALEQGQEPEPLPEHLPKPGERRTAAGTWRPNAAHGVFRLGRSHESLRRVSG
jgi:hypothetical protein